MLYNYYINREWIMSPTAKRVYQVAASLSLVFLCAIFAILADLTIPPFLFPWVRVLVLLGILGTATTFVAMEYFLFAFDTSPIFKRVIWFLITGGILILGPALYCFLVYSRAVPSRDVGLKLQPTP